MTREEKQLLLKDLCARLPYGVKTKITEEGVLSYDSEIGIIVGKEHIDNEIFIVKCKNDSWCLTAISEFVPYLRPMQSMTEDEETTKCAFLDNIEGGVEDSIPKYVDWLNASHFDYHGLIGKGLALEAPEGMYAFIG